MPPRLNWILQTSQLSFWCDPTRKGKETGKGGSEKAFDPKTEAEYATMWEEISSSGKTLSEKRELWNALKEAGKRNGVAS